MAFPDDPFVSIADFTTQYGKPLSAGESAGAERLLKVISDRIRDIKPDVNETAAQQVTFEVVRDCVTYADVERFSSFQNITSRRQESGTFDEAAKLVDDYFLPRHLRLLGIPVVAEPLYNFPDCDY